MFDKSQTLLTRYVASLRRSAKEAAEQLTILAEFAALDSKPEFTHLEVAAVSRVSETFARNRLELASALTTRLPRTMDALREGRIDEYKAKRVMLATEVLSDDLAAQVEEELIPQADAWSTRQLNDRLRRTVLRADPQSAATRAAARTAARRVIHEDLDDGGGLLLIHSDVERTQLADGRIQAIAKQIRSSGDTRTLDQLRADVALDLLAGKNFEHAKVHVMANMLTCTGPGCTRPAHQCDQDHLVPFPVGPTNQDNMHPACRTHHRAKTHGGWRITKTDTTLTWTTKHGFRFPHRRVPIVDPELRSAS
jgi:uncharacterized protein DUF222